MGITNSILGSIYNVCEGTWFFPFFFNFKNYVNKSLVGKEGIWILEVSVENIKKMSTKLQGSWRYSLFQVREFISWLKFDFLNLTIYKHGPR